MKLRNIRGQVQRSQNFLGDVLALDERDQAERGPALLADDLKPAAHPSIRKSSDRDIHHKAEGQHDGKGARAVVADEGQGHADDGEEASGTTRIQKRRIFPLPVRLYLVQSWRVARTPHFNLTEVKHVAASPDAILLSKTRARIFFSTPRLAAKAATRMLSELTESAFIETKFQNLDICDVYAYQGTPPITAMVAGTEMACRAWSCWFRSTHWNSRSVPPEERR